MSGQLVGEVLAASAELRAQGLSERGFHALVAIAEKCHPVTRQGSVPWKHVCDGLYGASKRTAERAVRDLKRVGVIRVVKGGFNNNRGCECAPIYEIQPLTDTDTAVTVTDTDTTVTASGGRYRQTGHRYRHPGVVLNGSINGKEAGEPKPGRSPAEPTTASTPPLQCRKHPNGNATEPCRQCMKTRQHQEQQAGAEQEQRQRLRHTIRAAIDGCRQCDDFGWVLNVEPLKRCEHPTISTLQTGS